VESAGVSDLARNKVTGLSSAGYSSAQCLCHSPWSPRPSSCHALHTHMARPRDFTDRYRTTICTGEKGDKGSEGTMVYRWQRVVSE